MTRRTWLLGVLAVFGVLVEASSRPEVWEQLRAKIAGRLHRQSYRTRFEPAYIGDFDRQRVVLEVPSDFFLDWLEEHYLDLIEKTFEEVLGHRVEVTIKIPKGGG
jgi:chromosomal replication initiator protein